MVDVEHEVGWWIFKREEISREEVESTYTVNHETLATYIREERASIDPYLEEGFKLVTEWRGFHSAWTTGMVNPVWLVRNIEPTPENIRRAACSVYERFYTRYLKEQAVRAVVGEYPPKKLEA